MPYHKIAAACSVFLFAVLAHPAFAQNTRSSKCLPATTTLECEISKQTDAYFALLRAKDWGALSRMGIKTRDTYEFSVPGENMSLRRLEQLLGPLKIETLTYTVSEVTASPDGVKVLYSMQLRATDPRSGKAAINVSGAHRVLEWARGFCNCPETGMRAWMLRRDAFSPANLVRAYLRARTDDERGFILSGLEKSALAEAAGELQRQGVDLINSGDYQGAFKILSRAQGIHVEIKHEQRLSSELDADDYEGQIKDANAAQNRPTLARLLKGAAETYVELKEDDKARGYYETSLRLFEEVGDGISAAEVHKLMADLRMGEGDYLGAEPALQRSIDRYLAAAAAGMKLDESATGDLAEAATDLFVLYELQGRDEDAARVVEGAQKLLPDEYKALFMFGRGFFQWLRGQSSSALDNNEKAFALLAKLPRTESGEVEGGLAGVSLFLSLAYSMQGDYTKAAIYLRRAREVIMMWKSADPEMAELGDMPQIFVQLMEAMFYGTESSEEALVPRLKNIMPRISETSDLSRVKLPLGDMDVTQMLDVTSMEYLQRGEYEPALQCLLLAQALVDPSDERLLSLSIQQHLAFYYTAVEDNARAVEHFNESLRLGEGLRAPVDEAVLGRILVALNLVGLASVHESTENYAEARRNYQKLLELFGPFTLFNYILHKEIAETYYNEHRYGEAIEELNKGLDLARRAGMRYFLWEMYQTVGRAHWANNEPTLARRDLEASVAEIEAMRRTVVGGEVVVQHFFEDKLSPYHDLVELLLQQGDCEGAFAYAERSKSRVLLDVLKRGRKYTKHFMSQAEQDEEVSLRRKLITFNRRVEEEKNRESGPGRLDAARGARAQARLDYELFRANLYVAHPELATAPVQEGMKVEELRDLLPSTDTALLEYVVTDYSVYLFTVTAEAEPQPGGGAQVLSPKCHAYSLEVSGADLEELVGNFRVRVSHPEGVLQKQALRLYDLLLRPAQQQLEGKKTLVIVPDGILWDLPFQALKPKADRYLLQDNVVYYAPSFTALREMKKVRAARAAGASVRPAGAAGDSVGRRSGLTLLAVGNPSLPDGRGTLQGTAELAKRMEMLYGRASTRVYTGADADEERVKSEAGNYQVIHIGTHGVLDNRNPMYSYVLLSQGQQEPGSAAFTPEAVTLDLSEDLSKDGLLEAWEMMELELNARLVVLSACETARGRVGEGEGLVGLSWALFMAGSPATVASQWKVDEQGTNELMYSFHENFVSGTRSPGTASGAAAALQKASLKLMGSAEYKHPYYWAGFVLIGDGS